MLNWSRLSLKRMCYGEACNNSVDSFYNRVNSRSSRGWGKCASRKKYLAKEASPSTFVQEMLSLKNMEQGCPNPAKQDGVVLGADTRATAGQIVCDKNCEKIHDLAPNISCCVAGTSADTENLTDMVSSQLELLRYESRIGASCESHVVTALSLLKSHLFRYHGEVSAALVLGGVDLTGPHLHAVYPHGSVDTLPFVTMGSGSVAAMAMFESRFKEGMTKDEATNLVCAAINAGISYDLGSGSNVDLCIITKGGKE